MEKKPEELTSKVFPEREGASTVNSEVKSEVKPEVKKEEKKGEEPEVKKEEKRFEPDIPEFMKERQYRRIF